MRDTNGSTITAGYNAAGQMTSLTDSSGARLTLSYNAAGLIASVTDSAGRQAVYTYDATNQYLMGVQTAAGTTPQGVIDFRPSETMGKRRLVRGIGSGVLLKRERT